MNLKSILNANEIVEELQLATDIAPVPIIYFEGRAFKDQVAFFSSIDLLISPHGAQLTGIFFMPSPCSAVLELFPNQYYIPSFFGSLAETGGLEQYVLYLSNETLPDYHNMRTNGGSARGVNLCPPLANIVQAAKIMIEDWKVCCERHGARSVRR